MKIEIKNCNNVDSGVVEIIENRLNIKYAINGTGKSTLARAIFLASRQTEDIAKALTPLTSFKNISVEGNAPEIIGFGAASKVKVFNEEYISEFVFQPNELLKSSFDIFIRDTKYEEGMREIDSLVEKMKTMFSEEKEIDSLIQDFSEISSSFGKPTKSGIHGSSKISQAFKAGNKVANIPEGLEGFQMYIQHSENFKWIKWQLDGKGYIDISDDCPYCISDIKTKKDVIRKVGETYDSKSIESQSKIVATFERLNKYFSDETKLKIDTFVKTIDGFTDDQIAFLKEIKEQIDRLSQKFTAAKNLGFSSLKDVEKVVESLKSHRIDIDLYNHLTSESTKSKVDIINESIDELLLKAGLLQGNIKKQNILISRLVEEYNTEINEFLKNAGYKYKVALLADESGQHKLRLIHEDSHDALADAKGHLSYGERNAISLVLFMYDAIKSNADFVVLDDPISSFDKNKKYAIIEMLFQKPRSFRGKTVLLLTHDLDPVVDMINHHSSRFEKTYASFLENSNGILSEKNISKSDIKTFIAINEGNSRLAIHVINRLVYLRRLLEVTGVKTHAYDLISNLLHKRDVPTKRDDEAETVRDMTAEEITSGHLEVHRFVEGFDYASALKLVNDNGQMKDLYLLATNNYEKLHIYRIIFDGLEEIDSDVVKKFINEAFHIENNYIYQLDPRDYQLVPQYVIDECDKFLLTLN